MGSPVEAKLVSVALNFWKVDEAFPYVQLTGCNGEDITARNFDYSEVFARLKEKQTSA